MGDQRNSRKIDLWIDGRNKKAESQGGKGEGGLIAREELLGGENKDNSGLMQSFLFRVNSRPRTRQKLDGKKGG